MGSELTTRETERECVRGRASEGREIVIKTFAKTHNGNVI
jgi:hypothetical protein